MSRYHYLLADYQFSVASHKSMDQSITYTCLVIEFSFFFCLLILYILYHNTPRRASYYKSIQNNMKKGARACLTKLGGTFAVLVKMKFCFEDLRSKAFQWKKKDFCVKKRTKKWTISAVWSLKGPSPEFRTFSQALPLRGGESDSWFWSQFLSSGKTRTHSLSIPSHQLSDEKTVAVVA